MKKIFLLMLCSMLGVSTFAQNSGGGASKGSTSKKTSTTTTHSNREKPSELETDAEEAATIICDCINAALGDLHPELTKMMLNIVDKGEEEAQKEFTQYFATASAEDQSRIMQDIQKMNNIEQTLSSSCDAKMKKFDQYENNNTFEQATLKSLSNKPNCQLTYQIMLSKVKKD
jgi:hypothetical protein